MYLEQDSNLSESDIQQFLLWESQRGEGDRRTVGNQTPKVWIRSGNEISSIEFTDDDAEFPMDMTRPLLASGHTSYVIRDGYTEKTHTPFVHDRSDDPAIRNIAKLADEVNFQVDQSRLIDGEMWIDPKTALLTSPMYEPVSEETSRDISLGKISPEDFGDDAWKRRVTLGQGGRPWIALGNWLRATFDYMGNNKEIEAPNYGPFIGQEQQIQFKKEERIDGSYRMVVISREIDEQNMYDALKRELESVIRSRMSGENRGILIDDDFLRKQTKPFIDNFTEAHKEQAKFWEQMLSTHGIEAISSTRVMTQAEMDQYQQQMTEQFRRGMLGGD